MSVKQESTVKILRTFEVDVTKLTDQGHKAKLSGLFTKMDSHFIRKFSDRKDMLRTYRDIPLSLDRLYKDSGYISQRHGHDLQICIDPQLTSKKRRR
jgi:hypothetical protein